MPQTTEEEYKKQIEDLRELHRQAVEAAQQAAEETLKAHADQLTMAHNEKDLVDAELAALKLQTIPDTSFNTPVPRTNISNQLQTAGYIDRQMLNDALREITNEALEREDRMFQNMTALIMSSLQNNAIPPSNVSQTVSQNPSNVAASTSPAPQPLQNNAIPPSNVSQPVSQNPSNVAASTSPAPQYLNLAASTSSAPQFLNLAASTSSAPNLSNAAPTPQIVSPNLSNAAPTPQIVSPNLSKVDPLPTAPRKPAHPIYYPTIFICGSEDKISYPPQSINNIPAESTSPSSSQRAAREQSSTQTPRIERVGEYSNENTSSSPPHTENIVKHRLETNRGRVRFSKTWARDNCSPVHFIPFTNTNLRCAIT